MKLTIPLVITGLLIGTQAMALAGMTSDAGLSTTSVSAHKSHVRRHHRVMRHTRRASASTSRLHMSRTGNAIHITGSGTTGATTNVTSSSPSVNDSSRDNQAMINNRTTTGVPSTNSVPMKHHGHSQIPPVSITNNGQSPAGTGTGSR